jgi:predicted acetyltransferase
MASGGVELRELDDRDVADSVRMSRRSFGFPPTPAPRPPRIPAAGAATRLGAFLGGKLVGQAFDLHDRQWWDGELLGAADIAGVSVAAEARGQGLARKLLARVLAGARDRGAVVSVLFPSISTVYRALGWASVGRLNSFQLPTLALPRTRDADAFEIREGTVADLPAVHDCYTAIARSRNGMLSRTELRFQPEDDELPSGVDGLTLALAGGRVAGFYTWSRGSHYGQEAALTVPELLAESPAAARALTTVLHSWHTVVPVVRMRLLGGDAVADSLPLELGTVHKSLSWMQRPVDVAGAVAARKWPAGVRGRAVFDMVDDLAPWNTGTWELSVSDGVGELRPASGPAAVRLSVAGFASLYCGLSGAAALRESGHVVGSRDDAAALDVLATSTPPRLLNSF